MKKTGALANALRSSGATLAANSLPAVNDDSGAAGAVIASPSVQANRRMTKPITVHFPEEVRRQLKALAGEEGRHVDDMVAEALNLLFARYRKGEIAPRKIRK